MNLFPLSDNIILSPLRDLQAGSIMIPEKFREDAAQGIVIAVGPGKLTKSGVRIPLEVKIGDKVLCNKLSADPIRYEGKDYKVVAISDVLAIL